MLDPTAPLSALDATLAEIEKLREKATPGPLHGRSQYLVALQGEQRAIAQFPSGGGRYVGVKNKKQAQADREYVQALWNAWPALRSEIARLREENDILRDDNGRMLDWIKMDDAPEPMPSQLKAECERLREENDELNESWRFLYTEIAAHLGNEEERDWADACGPANFHAEFDPFDCVRRAAQELAALRVAAREEGT